MPHLPVEKRRELELRFLGGGGNGHRRSQQAACLAVVVSGVEHGYRDLLTSNGLDGSPTPAVERLLAAPCTGSAEARASPRSGNTKTQQKLYTTTCRLHVVCKAFLVEDGI